MKKLDTYVEQVGSNADESLLRNVIKELNDNLHSTPSVITQRLDAVRHAALLRTTWQPDNQQLPSGISARLDAIRRQAILQAQSQSQPKSSTWLDRIWPPKGFTVPVSAITFSCLLAVTLTLFSSQNRHEAMPLVAADSDLVLVPDQQLELYENMEFYQWLVEAGLP